MNKIEGVYKAMLRVYGKQGWWPISEVYKTKKELGEEERFEIILGAILTQNTSWSNVEKALGNLRKNKLLDIRSIRGLDLNKLADLIKSSGYNNQKARKLKEIIKFLDSNEEINRENLLKVWGVGNETADSILLYAYGKPYFVIDSYTRRIFSRLGFCKEDIDYDKLQELFHSNLKTDNKLFNEYHALVVRHAKEFCNKKPECGKCFLKSDCRLAKNLLSKGIS